MKPDVKNTEPRVSNAISHLAAGLRDAGVSLLTNHPGFRSNELMDAFYGHGAMTSSSERNAYALAWGHAIGGLRAAVAFKNVGLSDAADPFLNSLNLDLNAGLVCLVFDDTDVEHSQLRMDARHYQSFHGGIWLEPASLAEARRFVKMAFDLSEQFSQPVVVRVTNALLARGGWIPQQTEGESAGPAAPGLEKRNPAGWVAHPLNYASRLEALSAKRAEIYRWSERFSREQNPRISTESEPLHIVFGAARVPKSVPADRVIHLSGLPLPVEFIREIAAGSSSIGVSEHGDAFVAERTRSILFDHSVQFHECGNRHPNRTYHCRDLLAPVFEALRSFAAPVLVGDLGGYTMDTNRSIDACLCYGASIATATGIALARPEATVSVLCGDGAFLHSAKSAIAEALARNCRLLVIVLENGGCRGTGGQCPPGDTWVEHPSVFEMKATFDVEAHEAAVGAIRRVQERPERVRVLHLQTPF